MIEFNEGYQRYINSPAWKEKRAEALEHYGRRCSLCDATSYLQVHHRTYARFGHERMGDLQVVCADCHAAADVQRKRQKRAERDVELMPAWAEEHYGPAWWESVDWPDMMERYRAARVDACNALLSGGRVTPASVRHFGSRTLTAFARASHDHGDPAA